MFFIYLQFITSKPKILSLLKKYNLQTRIIYPYPINTMKGYKMYSFDKEKLKISLKKSKGIFSLPLYPELEISEIKKICKILKKVLNKIN